MLLNIAFNFLFIRPLHNGGPALATSLSAFFNSISLVVIFLKRYGSMGGRSIVQSIGKFIVGSIALGVVVYVMIHWPGFYTGRLSQKVIALGVTIAAATATYFATGKLLNFHELAELRVVRSTKSEGSGGF
jgi:peptidoglycan biosynthesis protein MviN/MurJ (putative lipid II flippase)